MGAPTLSPDGRHAAYSVQEWSIQKNKPTAALWLTEVATARTRRLTAGTGSDTAAAWSPDGSRIAFVSFPPGTLGHPADLPVLLRLIEADGTVRDLISLFGGQGTINVASWAPDGRRLAYVDYPIED